MRKFLHEQLKRATVHVAFNVHSKLPSVDTSQEAENCPQLQLGAYRNGFHERKQKVNWG